MQFTYLKPAFQLFKNVFYFLKLTNFVMLFMSLWTLHIFLPK